MGIGHLLDHTADVWRKVETLGTFRESTFSYTKVYSSLPCTFQRRNTLLAADGPGLRAVGDRRVYFDTGPLFQDNDLVVLTAGPTGFVGPQVLEVESIAVPRGHHIELRATEYRGDVPQEVVVS